MAPTEVAAKVPIANTGKIKLLLVPSMVTIPVKESVLLSPGSYRVVATGITIATITYDINGFHVVPTTNSVKDARFAVYVNLSEQ